MQWGFASPENLRRLRDQERSGSWECEGEDHDRDINESKEENVIALSYLRCLCFIELSCLS